MTTPESRPDRMTLAQVVDVLLEQFDLRLSNVGNDVQLLLFSRFEAEAVRLALTAYRSSENGNNEIERAWQRLEACGVPKMRAGGNLARGIEVLSSRLDKEEHFQLALGADAARYRWLRNHPHGQGTPAEEKEWWPSVWFGNDATYPLQAFFLDEAVDNAIVRSSRERGQSK